MRIALTAVFVSVAAVAAVADGETAAGLTTTVDVLKILFYLLVAIIGVLVTLLYTPFGRKALVEAVMSGLNNPAGRNSLLDAVVTALIKDEGKNVHLLVEKIILPELKKPEYKSDIQQLLGVDPMTYALNAVKSAYDFIETMKKLPPPMQPPAGSTKEPSP